MKYGFIKTAAITPEIKVADTEFNAEQIIGLIEKAEKAGAELTVFPELSVTGYTCGDLFYSDVLLSGALKALKKIADGTKDKKILVFVGLPVKINGLLYNVAAAVNCGEVLCLIPKTRLPNYNEFYEKRWFAAWKQGVDGQTVVAPYFDKPLTVTRNVVFCDKTESRFTVSAEICEDLWAADSPSVSHAESGANIVVNLSCSDETVGKAEYRRNLIAVQSAKLSCAYVYADAGEGESTTDLVFAGHNLIAENGTLLNESKLFDNSMITADIDVGFLDYERSKIFNSDLTGEEIPAGSYRTMYFDGYKGSDNIERVFGKTPFVPEDNAALYGRSELILEMQAEGLKKRIKHTNAKTAVIGLSGGLDSTLAILVAVKAMGKLNRNLKDIIAVTMPCFGTTSRTFDNTVKLAKSLGVTLKKVDITKSVLRHLKDIKHSGDPDTTYENAQARERTQVIMDIANMTGGLVVGTGDLSELALGWATYNGDHMSMYGVNASVPKTLVRYIVRHYADASRGKLKAVLYDILDTPVSPELLPPTDGEIAQKTEDIVGPYILHDFYLYNMLRRGYSPKKIYFVARKTFKGEFDDQTILKWLKTFIKRFFAQQFKRSCVPDGVKVGSVALSPRGDLRMPSDAVCSLWINELEEL
ncbi:MAG: NAD(+) synthase [Clostridia bacterium]|nr:NAD(+) synthase [Clostridia bacterium]